MNTTDGIASYGLPELFAIIPEDRHAVRDECLRRNAVLAKKLAKLNAQLVKLNKENADLERVYRASL